GRRGRRPGPAGDPGPLRLGLQRRGGPVRSAGGTRTGVPVQALRPGPTDASDPGARGRRRMTTPLAPAADNFEEEATMIGFVGAIEQLTLSNKHFRHVLFTADHTQLVVMSLEPGVEIGVETHAGVDQF